MNIHPLKMIRNMLMRRQLRRQIQYAERARAWLKNVGFHWSTTWDGSPTQANIDATARLQQLNRELWNLRSRLESLK